MNWRELLKKARDLYAKAAECEDADERTSLTERAEALESRAKAAKKASEMEAEEKAWLERQPEDNGGGYLTPTESEEERKSQDPELPEYKSLGDQLYDIYHAGPGGRKPTPQLLRRISLVRWSSPT